VALYKKKIFKNYIKIIQFKIIKLAEPPRGPWGWFGHPQGPKPIKQFLYSATCQPQQLTRGRPLIFGRKM
jgi:hypothetical protein